VKSIAAAFGAAVLGAAALAAAGCATEDIDALQETAEYPLGYADGCATAEDRARAFSNEVVRDEALFRKSRAYAAGWRQGFNACGGLGAGARGDAAGGRVTGDVDEGPR